MADRAVLFTQGCAPYVAGDIAGFPDAKAQDLVDRGVAVFFGASTVAAAPLVPTGDLFDTMDRAGLVTYGRDKLGLTDDPPASVSDDDLRDALRAKAAAEQAQAPAPTTPADSAPAPDASTGAKGKSKA